MTILDNFNNREIALAIWLCIFCVFFFYKGFGKSFIPLLKSILEPKIFVPILLLLGYIFLEVYLLRKVGFWNKTMAKDTIYWVLGSAIVLFMQTPEIEKKDNFFTSVIFANLKLAVIIDFILNIYSFSLPAELVITLLVLFLFPMNYIAGLEEKHKAVKLLTNYLLSLIGLLIIGYTLYKICSSFSGFLNGQNIKGFLLSVILTIFFIPAIYLLGLIMLLESYFVTINGAYRHNKLMSKYVKWEVFKLSKLSIKRLRKIKKGIHVFMIKDKREFQESKKMLDL